jgi:hypothetical protein
MTIAKFKITLVCAVAVVFQALYFELININAAILILITSDVLLQIFLPNVQVANAYYYVAEEAGKNEK